MPRSFRFEAAWLEEDRCKEIVKEAWKDSLGDDGSGRVMEALSRVVGDLSSWSSNVLGDLEKTAKKIEERAGGMPKGG